MMFLTDFSVMNPSFGLLFWTTIIFLAAWFLLGKLAIKPIAAALKERESSIDEALHAADKAREEMRQIQSKHEELLKQAREERLKIIREAEEIKTKILDEARVIAEQRDKQMLESAKDEMDNRRREMEVNLYNEVGRLSLVIARQIMQRELNDNHDQFVTTKLEELKKQEMGA